MPVFAPTAAQSAKLATAVARGLYRLLGVHDNPSTMAVFVDNNLLSPAFDLQLSALRYANRLWKARTARNPASDILIKQLFAAAGGGHALSTARMVKTAESDFKSSFDEAKPDKKKLRKAALSKQRARAVVPAAGSSDDDKLRRAMLPAEGPAVYLQLLPRREASTLALFRYNRVRLNHVAARRGAAAPADCPFCPGVAETTRHSLLDCNQYARERKECFEQLARMYVPTDYATLLGQVEPLHKDRRKKALKFIVQFLIKIRGIRKV
jgi:hypothetical protein